jgi:hypothetical protein
MFRVKKSATIRFAPVPDTVWIEAMFLSSFVVSSELKVSNCTRLINVEEPAMLRYSWLYYG